MVLRLDFIINYRVHTAAKCSRPMPVRNWLNQAPWQLDKKQAKVGKGEF